ncbi:hypothetical protein CHU92_10655 [Flavobacterium cyanobacteriorum]|uniref:Uncharacterized protein n=1 Tax=Flavobacterium cyanobacteriorum TaxID=2022802 RepID=A0A255Z449_9FLAO|nr:hypothetical protein [Flavobacterium cyanobacteriorum]OYQ35665.1 hypothetical protein CHU92_10655 [Flavobacterium cyanobacteriorum]
MLKDELYALFAAMPDVVRDKLKPVMDNLLERAGELDYYLAPGTDDYEDEREQIMKEVNKIKYINDHWQIINAAGN